LLSLLSKHTIANDAFMKSWFPLSRPSDMTNLAAILPFMGILLCEIGAHDIYTKIVQKSRTCFLRRWMIKTRHSETPEGLGSMGFNGQNNMHHDPDQNVMHGERE
jgi:hypothetical protein